MMRGIAAVGLVLAALWPSVARAASCANAIQDGTETDVDCGGPSCWFCTPGLRCLVPTDCTSFVCSAGICQLPSCVDGVRNGDEVDVDCGGSTCSPCASCTCLLPTDCGSGVCQNCQCMPPTCTDGVRNGNEVTVDCGGSCVPCAPPPDSGMSGDAMPTDAGGSSPSDTGPPALDAAEPDAPQKAGAADAATVSTHDASSASNDDSGTEARDGSVGQTPMPTTTSAPTVSPPSSTDSGTLHPANGPDLNGRQPVGTSACGCRIGAVNAPREGPAMILGALTVLLMARRRDRAAAFSPHAR